jgi:hypothetical protein
MGHICNLRVRQWAAICVSDGEEVLGSAGAEDIIPAGIRRRMGKLERLSVRCTLGLLAGGTTSAIIFCSRYGNIETLGSMFSSIAAGELISPMAFSGSVHNAAPGLVTQISKERIVHTALAAGPHTFEAGLVEAYAHLTAEDCSDVVVCYADLPLPELYTEFEVEHRPGLALALRVEPGAAGKGESDVLPGRAGALDVLARLQRGESELVVGGGAWLVPQ